MFRILPYKVGSASVKKLKTALNALIIKVDNSHYRYRDTHTIINWGNSRRPSWMSTDVPVLNSPEAVYAASNKLQTFHKLEEHNVPCVLFTSYTATAYGWLEQGKKVFVRHSVTGHSGEGIEVITPQENHSEEVTQMSNRLIEIGYQFAADYLIDQIEIPTMTDVPDAPLYTLGVQNHGEYRVHVFGGEVILYQKKSRRVDEDGNVATPDGEEADVRNLASNWVYRTGNLRRLERVEQLAIDAVQALGLDFGAVDIIKDEEGNVLVLEVNSAAGLGNTETLEAYTRAFNGEPAVYPDEVTTDV